MKLSADKIHGMAFVLLIVGLIVFVFWRYFVNGFWNAVGGGLLYAAAATFVMMVIVACVKEE